MMEGEYLLLLSSSSPLLSMQSLHALIHDVGHGGPTVLHRTLHHLTVLVLEWLLLLLLLRMRMSQ